MTDRRAVHALALSDADARVRALTPGDLDKASACAGWTIRDLLEHMTGQNVGFAEAIRVGDAPLERYVPLPVERWAESVKDLRGALSDPRPSVRLVEVAGGRELTIDSVLGIHALDLAAHTWDLDQTYRSGAELTQFVLDVARSIPPRQGEGGPFAPVVGDFVRSGDAWTEALALIGRR